MCRDNLAIDEQVDAACIDEIFLKSIVSFHTAP